MIPLFFFCAYFDCFIAIFNLPEFLPIKYYQYLKKQNFITEMRKFAHDFDIKYRKKIVSFYRHFSVNFSNKILFCKK